jgi:hypothetical protein
VKLARLGTFHKYNKSIHVQILNLSGGRSADHTHDDPFESQRRPREDFGVSGLPSYASIYPSSFLLVLAESFEIPFGWSPL